MEEKQLNPQSLYMGTVEKHTGKFTISAGLFIIVSGLLSLFGFNKNNIFSSSALNNIISCLIIIAIGIIFLIIGIIKRDHFYYYRNEFSFDAEKKKKFKIAKCVFTIISVVLFMCFLGVFIYLLVNYSTLNYVPFVFTRDFALFSYILGILGSTLWLIFFLRSFGTQQSTLFSTGILCFSLSFIESITATIYEYLLYYIGKDSNPYYSEQLDKITPFSIASNIVVLLFILLLLVVSYNIKNRLPKKIFFVITIIIALFGLYSLVILIISIINSIKYHYFGLNVFTISNCLLGFVVCIMTNLFQESYFIIFHYNSKKQIKTKKRQKHASIITIEQNQIRFCRICGNSITNDSLFCNKCGTKIIKE